MRCIRLDLKLPIVLLVASLLSACGDGKKELGDSNPIGIGDVSSTSSELSTSSTAASSIPAVSSESSSVTMPSSLSTESSSSTPTPIPTPVDCSAIELAKSNGMTEYQNVSNGNNCIGCHGAFDVDSGEAPGGISISFNVNSLTRLNGDTLAVYLTNRMMRGLGVGCNEDAACEAEANDIADYLLDTSCDDSSQPPSSSSEAIPSSSSVASSLSSISSSTSSSITSPVGGTPVDCSMVDVDAGELSFGTAGCSGCHGNFDEATATAPGRGVDVPIPSLPPFDINNPTEYDESTQTLNVYLATEMMNTLQGCESLTDVTEKNNCYNTADNIATYLKQFSSEPYCSSGTSSVPVVVSSSSVAPSSSSVAPSSSSVAPSSSSVAPSSSSVASSSSSSVLAGCDTDVQEGMIAYDSKCVFCHSSVPTDGTTIWTGPASLNGIDLFDSTGNGYDTNSPKGTFVSLDMAEYLSMYMPPGTAVTMSEAEKITAYMTNQVEQPWCPGDDWPTSPATSSSSVSSSSSSSSPVVSCDTEIQAGMTAYGSKCVFCHSPVPTDGTTIWTGPASLNGIDLFDSAGDGYDTNSPKGTFVSLDMAEYLSMYMPPGTAVTISEAEEITAYMTSQVNQPWCPGTPWP